MSYRILVLNDNPHELKLLEMACVEAGHTLVTLATISQAMEWLNTKDHVDVVVSDVHLHNENVFDFLKAVKKDPRHDWIQFIMVCSSNTDLAASMNEQLQTAARLLGADKYIMMPEFCAERLLREIDAALPEQPPQSEQDPVRDHLGLPRPAQEVEKSIKVFDDKVADNIRRQAKRNG